MDKSSDSNNHLQEVTLLNITSKPLIKRKKESEEKKLRQAELSVKPQEFELQEYKSEKKQNLQLPLKKQNEFLVKRKSIPHKSSEHTETVHSDYGEPVHKKQRTSSLFKSNPDIPQISVSSTQGKEEPLFSNKTFGELNLHPHLVSCLQSRFSIEKLTEVQHKTIPYFLNGKDVLVKSCTGSGKTLAYAVPIVQMLQDIRPRIQRSDGVYAVIILPTRELALQSFECFSTLTKAFTWLVPGYVIGGEKKKSEKARIRKGINILICTPGRLLDHLEHTVNLNLSRVKFLVIDEADKLLEQGFEEAILKIVSRITENAKGSSVQKALLSATLTREVEKLAGISLSDPVYIDTASSDENSCKMVDLVIPPQLKQYVVIIPTKLRLVTLSSFIIDKCSKGSMKALIFMCTQNCVDFHFLLFNCVLKSMLKLKGHRSKYLRLHGNMKQEERTEVFNRFKKAHSGVLLCTDVAARGLDLPHVNWIIQYSAPVSAEYYVHQVGRTARIGQEGQSLLFLMPSEIEFVNLLQQYEIRLKEIDMKEILCSLQVMGDVISERTKKQEKSLESIEKLATDLQLMFENFIYSEESNHIVAKEAFLSYVHAYMSYQRSLHTVLPFHLLHLGHAAKSFCLRETPSELGRFRSKLYNPHKQRNERFLGTSRKPKKTSVSEYDSGIEAWKKKQILSTKKIRNH